MLALGGNQNGEITNRDTVNELMEEARTKDALVCKWECPNSELICQETLKTLIFRGLKQLR